MSIIQKHSNFGILLAMFGLMYTQIVNIFNNFLGEPRGFGFVDFYDVQTAEKWMQLSKVSKILLIILVSLSLVSELLLSLMLTQHGPCFKL